MFTAVLLSLAAIGGPPQALPFRAQALPFECDQKCEECPGGVCPVDPKELFSGAMGIPLRYKAPCGTTIAIVPEAPKPRTINVVEEVSNCYMGCCPVYRTVQKQVAWNKPTPLADLADGLAALKLTEDDVLYDLGCGDGRVVVMAAKLYGCRAVGLDVRAEAIPHAIDNAKLNGVSHLTRFYKADANAADLSQATVLYAHLDAAQSDLLARQVRAHPQTEQAISFQHKPRGLNAARHGEFYLWKAKR